MTTLTPRLTRSRGPRAESDVLARLDKLEEALNLLADDMKKVASDTEDGRKLLGRLNDQWLVGRAFTWSKVAAIALATTYQQWLPVVARIGRAFIDGGSHG